VRFVIALLVEVILYWLLVLALCIPCILFMSVKGITQKHSLRASISDGIESAKDLSERVCHALAYLL